MLTYRNERTMNERLYKTYIEKVAPKLVKELKLENIMEVPAITKVSVNAGIGGFRESREAVEAFVTELADLTNQKPFVRRARKSEAGFKIRRGDDVGYAVTLRNDRMWAFLDKLISIVLPRVRDFRGLSRTSFDENGNYSFGMKEHTIFPEVNQNSVKGIRSLQITITIKNGDQEKNLVLLEELGFPFKKVQKA